MISQDTINHPQTALTNQFCHFIEDLLSPEILDQVVSSSIFEKLICLQMEYGDYTFHDVVNLVAAKSDMKVIDLLRGFSQYIGLTSC